MTELGVPDFGVGVNINEAGNVNSKGSIYGQEVYNTENIDRSNAEQVVTKEINQVRRDYGKAWYYGIPVVGPALESGDNLGWGNYSAATAAFGMALVDVITLGEASGGTALARRLGKAGEDAIGIVGSKIRIPSLKVYNLGSSC